MVGGTLSFLGPSTLLSTIFRLLERPRWRRRRLFVVNRDDEPRLPRQVEAAKVVCFGLENHPAGLGGADMGHF